jgi:hypothetical protein
MRVDRIRGGNVTIDSGNLTFGDLRGSTVNVDAGTINLGDVNAGNTDIQASGSVNNRNSVVDVSSLELRAGGNVGSESDPLTVRSSRLERISGNNVYVDAISGGNIQIGLISASGELQMSAVNVTPDGGFVDGNGGALNFDVGGDTRFNVSGRIGTAADAMETAFGGDIYMQSGNVNGTITPDFFLWANFVQAFGNPRFFFTGNGLPLGEVIFNGSIRLGKPGIGERFLAGLSSFAEFAPSLDDDQGVFGNPYFIHEQLAVAAAMVMDFINLNMNKDVDLIVDISLPLETQTKIQFGGVTPATTLEIQPRETEEDQDLPGLLSDDLPEEIQDNPVQEDSEEETPSDETTDEEGMVEEKEATEEVLEGSEKPSDTITPEFMPEPNVEEAVEAE